MPQSLIQLPKEADIIIGECEVRIKNHKVDNSTSIMEVISDIVCSSPDNRNILSEFEKHGISFETAIENCVEDLEEKPYILGYITWHNLLYIHEKEEKMWNMRARGLKFSESEAGRTVAGIYVEKIRSCNNWEELHDELNPNSKFSRDMAKHIKGIVKQ